MASGFPPGRLFLSWRNGCRLKVVAHRSLAPHHAYSLLPIFGDKTVARWREMGICRLSGHFSCPMAGHRRRSCASSIAILRSAITGCSIRYRRRLPITHGGGGHRNRQTEIAARVNWVRALTSCGAFGGGRAFPPQSPCVLSLHGRRSINAAPRMEADRAAHWACTRRTECRRLAHSMVRILMRPSVCCRACRGVMPDWALLSRALDRTTRSCASARCAP